MGDNPPAFPFVLPDGCGGFQEAHSGMTLRDWFAGEAMAGFLSDGSQRLINEACKEVPEFVIEGPLGRAAIVNEQIAVGCYALADAMLAARESP